MNTTISYEVWCTYPVSGTYTQLQRILFWVVVIFILFLQFHAWFTAAAAAFVVSYSVTAGIHAIILGVQKSSAYDADLVALELVVQSSIFAALLCFVFSPRIFDRPASGLWLGWCLLMLIARTVMQYTATSIIVSLDEVTIAGTCRSEACQNPCASLDKPTMFRGAGSDLQPVVWSLSADAVTLSGSTSAEWLLQAPMKSDEGYAWLRYFWLVYVALGLVLQSAIMNTVFSPQQARNHIFRRLRMEYVPRSKSVSTIGLIAIHLCIWIRYIWKTLMILVYDIFIFNLMVDGLRRMVEQVFGFRTISFHDFAVLEASQSPTRYFFGKTLGTVYCWAQASYCALVGGAAYLTFKAEHSIQWVPESEPRQAVGQWSPWVTLCLAVLAAGVSRVVSGPNQESKKRILLADSESQKHGAHEIVAMRKELEESNWHFHRYFPALLIYQWQDFKYWWSHTAEASELDYFKVEEKVTKEKPRQDPEILDLVELRDDLPPFDQILLRHGALSHVVHLLEPDTRSKVDYSYAEDEELQIFLYSEERSKREARLKMKRRSWVCKLWKKEPV